MNNTVLMHFLLFIILIYLFFNVTLHVWKMLSCIDTFNYGGDNNNEFFLLRISKLLFTPSYLLKRKNNS